MPDTFAPYTGEWNFQKAAHLLRRTTFVTEKQSIEELVNQDLPFVGDIFVCPSLIY